LGFPDDNFSAITKIDEQARGASQKNLLRGTTTSLEDASWQTDAEGPP